MLNLSRFIDVAEDPKFQFLNSLLKNCFNAEFNHSQVVEEPGVSFDWEGPYCPRTFDGFACWDETPASAVAVQRCPKFVIGFDPRRLAFKSCSENGTWWTHPEGSKPWTNYTTCVDIEDLNFRTAVNNIYISGYALSIIALIISLGIFFYFRSLRCTRIRIHMHLFASFAFNNALWILWYRTVVNRPDVMQENKAWCQLLHVVTHYFMVANYIWMFCESLHLHIALVVVFVKDDLTIRWFAALGWGLPFLIMLVYATARYFVPGATVRCWMEHSDTFWIIIVPVALSLLTSSVFLVNVVRVLLTKLHPGPNSRASLAARKAARATLILIPLFGLHFILIPLRPNPDSPYEKAYQIISSLLTSLQGLCVSVLFCFTNNDVITAIGHHLSKMAHHNDGIAMTGMSGFFL